MKQIVYVDMDGTLVDFQSGIDCLSSDVYQAFREHPDDVPGIFSTMVPMRGAVESFRELAERFDTYILSTAPWDNPLAWAEKVVWVRRYLGDVAYKRLILSHHKDLNRGDFLIDDSDKNGAADFEGTLIRFRSNEFPTWAAVMEYMRGVAGARET